MLPRLHAATSSPSPRAPLIRTAAEVFARRRSTPRAARWGSRRSSGPGRLNRRALCRMV